MKSVLVSAALAVGLTGSALAQSDAERVFRAVNPEDVLVMTVDTDGRRGQVAIELAPWLAPRSVEQVRTLARARYFDGLDFYRVIENFVAQGGAGGTDRDVEMPDGTGTLDAELQLASDELPEVFEAVENEDMFASETGFIKGFAMARDEEEGPVWPVHCPGSFALARGNDINSASTEFYFPIGQAPRHLDGNMTIIGRVIDGFEHIQGVKRDVMGGDGVIDDPAGRSIIVTVRVAADNDYAPRYEVEDTRSDAFLNGVDRRKKRRGPFWHKSPVPLMDVCTMGVRVRKVETE